MSKKARKFAEYRQKMNERILESDNRVIKRMFSVDSLAYQEGKALDRKTRELIGLVSSLVLRCDDCVSYHIGSSVEAGTTREELMEAMSIGLVVGGTIVIPHLRRAVDFLDEILADE